MKKYLQMIVDNGKREDMECLSDILVELMYELKESNHGEYEEYKRKIIGMAYDYSLTNDLAQDIVKDMKPRGEYWDKQTIISVVGNQPKINDIYVVMNSLANDYGDVIPLDEVETYVKMANAWLNDADAKENKVWWYFVG